ncbi:hypothetical protein D1872_261080 [compost metagenome]
MGRQKGMRDIKRRRHRDSEVQERHFQFFGDGIYDRDEQNQAHLKEEGDPDNKRSDDYRDLNALSTEAFDQGGGDPVAAPRIGDQLAQHGADPEDQGKMTELTADALFDGGDNLRQVHTQADRHNNGGNDQGNKGVQLQLHDHEQQQQYADGYN